MKAFSWDRSAWQKLQGFAMTSKPSASKHGEFLMEHQQRGYGT